MKRISFFITTCVFLSTAATAQSSSGSASQTATVILSNSIDISYMATGDRNGNSAIMQFSTPSDYSHGVTSPEQQLRVRSNKNFKVAVRCEAANFDYQGGSATAIENMPDNALWLRVTSNQTGGAVRAPFSTSGYANLSDQSQDLLVNGNYGGNQTFAVQYKCTPGYNLPAGTYTMNVVFTATQE